MNILFTNFCNRSCVYCFAKGKLALDRKSQDSHISFKNLKIIINFLKTSKQTTVGILGGEPTLHPHFKKAITMILTEGLNIKIYSNGIIRKDIISFLQSIDRNKWEMLLNINDLKSYTNKEWSRIHNVLKMLNKQITLGFNIYMVDFDAEFLIELIKKYELRNVVRLGTASPLYKQNNKFLSLKDHKKIAPKIVQFAKKCDVLDISVTFDCNFNLCSFTEKELGQLFYYNSPLETDCPTVIDVGPDLTLWRCFATSMIWNKKLTDFTNLDEINRFYMNKFKTFQRVGVLDKCFRCKYLRRQQCSGGCLGHTLKSFK